MAIGSDKDKTYLERLFKFYFATAPIWRAFLTIFYLAFFSYFSVFYSGKLWIAFKFILYTITHSVSFLTLGYLLWGVVFFHYLNYPIFRQFLFYFSSF
jgi:lysylphosphatidylglycerol synthetase-like protein (DUF2156 family)